MRVVNANDSDSEQFDCAATVARLARPAPNSSRGWLAVVDARCGWCGARAAVRAADATTLSFEWVWYVRHIACVLVEVLLTKSGG